MGPETASRAQVLLNVTGVRPESITTTFLLLTLVCWQSTLKCFGSLMVSGCTYFLCEVYRWF